MDVQYLGLALITAQASRPPLTTQAAIEGYYERHAHAYTLIPKIASFVVALGFGMVTFGLRLQ